MTKASGHLFTIVCEYDGGTYVSQVHASDEQHAVKEWASWVRSEQPIADDSGLVADAAINDDSPVALKGLLGAWCFTTFANDKLVLATIIRSSSDIG